MVNEVHSKPTSCARSNVAHFFGMFANCWTSLFHRKYCTKKGDQSRRLQFAMVEV